MKLPISVSVITHNEEINLRRCLQSISDLAGEIVVIDSGSTDATAAVAREYGAVFEYQPWGGFVSQKNYALTRCSQPWILQLDADEALSEKLRQTLFSLFAAGGGMSDGYWLNRKTFYLNRWIDHAWYPEWRLRLVRKDLAHWEGTDPHGWMKTPSKTGRLAGDLLHYSYTDLNDHLLRTIRYAKIGAEASIRKGESFRWYKLAFSPWVRFFRSLVLKQAWREGWRGWIIAFSSMLSCFAKYAFMYEHDITRKDSGRNDGS